MVTALLDVHLIWKNKVLGVYLCVYIKLSTQKVYNASHKNAINDIRFHYQCPRCREYDTPWREPNKYCPLEWYSWTCTSLGYHGHLGEFSFHIFDKAVLKIKANNNNCLVSTGLHNYSVSCLNWNILNTTNYTYLKFSLKPLTDTYQY